MERARAAALSPERKAPSMVEGSPVSVQSPARNRFVQRVWVDGRLASCAGVAAKVARFSFTMRQGEGIGKSMHAHDVAPDAPGQRLRIGVQQRIGIADGDGEAVVEGEDPFCRAADHADHRLRAFRRGEAEMRVQDGAEIVRRLQPRHQFRGHPGRHGQHHGLVPPDRHEAIGEGQGGDALALEFQPAQPAGQADPGALAAQMRQGRVHEGGGQGRLGDARAAGATAPGQAVPHHGAGEVGRAFLRAGVQGGDQEGLEQAFPERAGAVQHLVDPLAGMRAQQLAKGEVARRPGAGHAAGGAEDPPGQGTVIRPQPPGVPVAQVGEGEIGRFRPGQPVLRPDGGEIAGHGFIAGQDEMVAVVDHQAELAVAIGAATPPGLRGRFRQLHRQAPPGQRHRRREPGHPGPHHMGPS